MTNGLKVCSNQVAGSYDFIEQYISFDALAVNDIQNAHKVAPRDKTELSIDSYNSLMKVLPLMFHELNHWVDHSTTLWGIKLTLQTLQAREAIKKKETHGSVLYEFHRLISKFKYPDYYNSSFPQTDASYPWRYQYSKGLLFDRNGNPNIKEPIIFTRFSNVNNDPLMRVPFSLCSVLEVGAIYQEVKTELEFIDLLGDGVKQVELKLRKEKYLNLIYGKDFGVYNVAVHSVANSIQNTDVISALRIAAVISRVVLNFPKSQMKKINVPSKYSVWNGSVSRMLENEDRGALFFLIADNLDVSVRDVVGWDNLIISIFKVLQNLGCDDQVQIKKEHDIEIYACLNEIEGISNEYCFNFKSIFHENYSLVDVWEPVSDFSQIYCPRMYLGDGEEFKTVRTSSSVKYSLSPFEDRFIGELNQFIKGCI